MLETLRDSLGFEPDCIHLVEMAMPQMSGQNYIKAFGFFFSNFLACVTQECLFFLSSSPGLHLIYPCSTACFGVQGNSE